MVLPKIPPSGTQRFNRRFNRIWEQKGLYRDNQVKDAKIRSSWIRMGPKSNHKSLEEEGNGNTDKEEKYHGKGHEKTEAEIGMMYVGAMQCQGLPAATRHGKRQGSTVPQSFQRELGTAKTLISDSGFQTCKRIHFCCFKPDVCDHLFHSPRK